MRAPAFPVPSPGGAHRAWCSLPGFSPSPETGFTASLAAVSLGSRELGSIPCSEVPFPPFPGASFPSPGAESALLRLWEAPKSCWVWSTGNSGPAPAQGASPGLNPGLKCGVFGSSPFPPSSVPRIGNGPGGSWAWGAWSAAGCPSPGGQTKLLCPCLGFL